MRFDSAAYRDYQCDPSDQFDGFTWCQKTSRERERRGSFDVSYTILHSRDGSAVYINRNQAPAFWDPNEVNEDIDRYSRKIGERPRIISMPRRQGLPNGIIAHWGNVVLEPLDSDSLKVLAEGKSPKKGILFDFVGNLARSAREGLPVYRVSGGAGFVWVASYDQNGGGTLRFSAVDASAFMPQVARTPVPTPPFLRPFMSSMDLLLGVECRSIVRLTVTISAIQANNSTVLRGANEKAARAEKSPLQTPSYIRRTGRQFTSIALWCLHILTATNSIAIFKISQIGLVKKREL